MTTRRAFLAASASLLLAPSSPADTPLPVIDTHIHVWTRKQLDPPWLRSAQPLLQRDYLPSDYAQAVAGQGVQQALYIEIAVDPAQRQAEADAALKLAAQDRLIRSAVVGAAPGQEGFAAYLRSLAKNPALKGIREGYRRGSDRNAAFLKDVKLLADLGLRYEFLLGGPDLAEAAAIAAACPQTPFVLDHCANPAPEVFAQADSPAKKQWREGIARLSDRPNVVCKISGLPECSQKRNPSADNLAPVLDHCLDHFGPDRVLFGSNWPVCLNAITLAGWLEHVRKLTRHRGESLQRKLLQDNALRFYALK